MSSQEDNTRELLRQLPQVDAPVGLEQRLRKRITAGEGKGMRPIDARRSSAPWFPYSIAASVLLVMLAGYGIYRNGGSPQSGSVQPVGGNESSVPANSSTGSSLPDPTKSSSTAAQSESRREQMQSSSAMVDKSTGNTHRDDPSDASALKLTGGTAMESMVPRSTQLSEAQQSLASPVSQTMSPYGPGLSNPIRSFNRTSSAYETRGVNPQTTEKTTYYRHPKSDSLGSKTAKEKGMLKPIKNKPTNPAPRP